LTNRFNETFFFAHKQHVCQQIGEKKLNKGNKNLQFKSKSSFTENNATDKAGAVKVSQKITTLIFHEISAKDNIELGRFHLNNTSRINLLRSVQKSLISQK